MPGDVTPQPLARAVLRQLADDWSGDDALGSLARTVQAGRGEPADRRRQPVARARPGHRVHRRAGRAQPNGPRAGRRLRTPGRTAPRRRHRAEDDR